MFLYLDALNISIYDNGGVFKQFETEFNAFHAIPFSHALLHNSGTNTLHAFYFAAELVPGDEVIFPIYTFHTTNSPAMYFGMKPVFCAALPNGTISPSAVADAMTPKTKAVVVCHMWGMPCDMDAICSIIKRWPGVLLFEDCSHAHGAKFNGKAVGTFGDGAAWSLQGQKIVTGGEGGISLTKHADFHYRMLILGHYNKRCKVEIPGNHPLRQFSLTGDGLKNRAHPLAIAIALNQLRKLEGFHICKSRFAAQLVSGLACIPFLEMPTTGLANGAEPAWYAFVMRFKATKAPVGLTRELFVEELHARGLVDVDIPKSTGLLHGEPLFNKPWEILPHLYTKEAYSVNITSWDYPVSQCFHDEAVKLPVFATDCGKAPTDRYVEIIREVAFKWMSRA